MKTTIYLFVAVIMIFGGDICTQIHAQTVSQSVKKELAQLMLRNGDIENTCVREQGGLLKAIIVELKYLNTGKQPEYLVNGDGSCCGGARRCNVWIYQKTSGGYRKIFGDKEGLQGDVELAKTSTRGYRDIITSEYSGGDVFRAMWRFDGSQFKHWKNLKTLHPGF